MKKVLSIITCLLLVFFIPHTVFAANQPVTISSGAANGTTVTVSGTTFAKAVMVQVRDANDTIIGMDALGVSEGAFSGSFTVEGLVFGGTYTIYAADYEGGAWTTMQVTVPITADNTADTTDTTPVTTPVTTVVNGQTVATSPTTGNSQTVVLIALIGLSIGGFALLKTRRGL